ncbi:pseudaminic acid biosynthesis-associated methylase [Vreelandella boliviensis]|uniref:Pseudaminic acid biosynthesis-associated methylase n=1 Tax=Vreelandella boliviensis LC1 TaxID=1072583 RepID=A0A265DV93_9GAMM|nr:pseudaminic acid biosynthesis-associated methylase [Halomonas boliviensis]EHJ94923.1 hypothetical protein KUC_1882 [Halomonas boliviensis LC1]OZT73242.1 pseudaminic acid biosynthesis-associated methylase [Halomonas boliviensis LC1]
MYKTDQENFWAGKFGDDYIGRNSNNKIIASNTVLFSKIMDRVSNVDSILEMGSNIGLNIYALSNIMPDVSFDCVEINANAAASLLTLKEKLGIDINVFNESILDWKPISRYDLVLLKTVLIHINPDELDSVYDKIFEASSKYIVFAEYYNPVPTEIEYRGHQDRLFKRDFCGEIMKKFEGKIKLVDYGFAYSKDPSFPQDDINWFLMEKLN